MVVRDFYFPSIVPAPDEANSALIVDANAVLPLAIASQFFQPIARGSLQIVEVECSVEHGQLALGNAGWRPSSSRAGSPDFRRFFVGESLDHFLIITVYINNVKR